MLRTDPVTSRRPATSSAACCPAAALVAEAEVVAGAPALPAPKGLGVHGPVGLLVCEELEGVIAGLCFVHGLRRRLRRQRMEG